MYKITRFRPFHTLLFLIGALILSGSAWSQTPDTSASERIYLKIEVRGLACPFCAYGMEKALKEVSGVEKVDIVLKKGWVFISTPLDQKPEKEQLEDIIIDAGFTPGKIEYSTQPFEYKADHLKQ